jgi:hypothetical protein
MLLGAALGLWLTARRKQASRRDVFLAMLVPMGAGVVLFYLFERIAQGPLGYWDAPRVAPAIGLVRGYDILPGLNEGPILDFMYGPMSALTYMPAALASTPSGAIWIGISLSFLIALSPLAWLAFRAPEPRSRLLAASATVCFGLLCMLDEGLRLAVWRIHADAPALGFAGWACACLLASRTHPTTRRMLATAVFAVLAVWSKQIAVPIVMALPLYVWLRDGRRSAFRCALWIGGVGAVVSLLFVLWFGFEGIVLNLFLIPAGHPWKPGAGTLGSLLDSLGRLAWTSRWSAGLTLAVAAVSYRRGQAVGSWLREQPWTGLAWVGICMVPTAVLGGVKVGGDAASYAMTTYFMAGAGALGLAQAAATARPRERQAAFLVTVGIIVFAVGYELGSARRRGALEDSVLQLRNWRSNPQEQATSFARDHPGEVLFASNPLIGIYSDGALYHDAKGIADRILANFGPPSPALLHAHIPPRLHYVAQRIKIGSRTSRRPKELFPEFTQPIRPKQLDRFSVWKKPERRRDDRAPP